MTTQEIFDKLWNLCNVLRADGITYHQYVTELTYILFLKMAKETGTEEAIPEAYRWDELVRRDGPELKQFYKQLLDKLGTETTGRVHVLSVLLAKQRNPPGRRLCPSWQCEHPREPSGNPAYDSSDR